MPAGQTNKNVQSFAEPLPDGRIAGDTDPATNVVWSAVEKGKLVQLVGHLTTGTDPCRQIQNLESWYPTDDGELRENRGRQVTTSDDSTEIVRDPASWKSYADFGFGDTDSELRGQLVEGHWAVVAERNSTWLKDVSGGDPGQQGKVVDLSTAISAGPDAPENHETLTSGARPLSAWANTPKSGTSKKTAKSSSEVWTSVDKSIVEELFDHVLRSFDDVRVGGPELDAAWDDGSRGPASSNQRSSPSGRYYVIDDRELWQSVAYKWKSHILQRMHTQQVSDHAVCRKRRYSDRKVVENWAYEG